MNKVAIVGAGPSGLVAARWLKHEGFTPVLFDKGDRFGGQWTGDPRYSGVWESMRTNTSHVMTAFSDLPHEPGTPTYPTNQAMLAYLEKYARRFDLLPCIRTRTDVHEISRAGQDDGWILRLAGPDGGQREEVYEQVVVAPGRYYQPRIPDVPGLDSFTGSAGVSHTFHYCPGDLRDLRVLVAGGSISALEVSSDLAMLGAEVAITSRRQRYILDKLAAGVPTDHTVFTRYAALARETLPPAAVAEDLRQYVLEVTGSPEQYGAAKPAESLLDAGIARCQHFLPLVAEGRIETVPWMTSVDGRSVQFAGGKSREFDAIIFGTGFDLDLPFLSDKIHQTLRIDRSHIELYKSTFHPDLPGLSFLGIMELLGPYFPALELQARWIAYTRSGARPLPERDEMEAGLAAYRSRRGGPQTMPMNAVCLQFAREAGVEPELDRWPNLARALLFGPLSPISFRLSGRDCLPDAPRRTMEEAAVFGAVPSAELTTEQLDVLQSLAAARHDAGFSRFVEQLSPVGSTPARSPS